MKNDSIEANPGSASPFDYANRIRQERQKRAWTQEYLAEKSGLSVRTVQRLECGETPATETLRMLADAFGIDAKDLERKATQSEFTPKYRWYSANRAFLVLCALFTAINAGFFLIYYKISTGSSEPWEITRARHHLFVSTAVCIFLWLNTPFLVVGYSVKNGALRLLHAGWAGKYDLHKLSTIARCPQISMGTLYLVPNGLFCPPGFYYNKLIGVFSGHVSFPENAVLMEFGRKKVVVTPTNPDEFIAAVREQAVVTCGIRELPMPACLAESAPDHTDYSEQIRAKREKRGWTQEELAEHTHLSVRTIQRLEKGMPPSVESLRLIAEAFEIKVDELSKGCRLTYFHSSYSKKRKAIHFTLFAFAFTMITCPIPQTILFGQNSSGMIASVVALTIWFSINLYMQVTGLKLKHGKLLVGHCGFVEKYDLSRLRGIETNPHALRGALPFTWPILIPSPWCRSALLGFFRAFVTNPAHCVILEFGKKKIVVSPDDPQAFVQAVREELKAMEEPTAQ